MTSWWPRPRTFLAAAEAEDTRRNYATDWRAFVSWCAGHQRRLRQHGNTVTAPTVFAVHYSYGYDKDGNHVTDAAGTHTFNAANQLPDPGLLLRRRRLPPCPATAATTPRS